MAANGSSDDCFVDIGMSCNAIAKDNRVSERAVVE
jgi:hypothetical protein